MSQWAVKMRMMMMMMMGSRGRLALTMPTQKTVKSRNQGRSVQLRSSSGLHSLFVL